MLRISKLTDYAMLIVSAMAKAAPGDAVVSAKVLAAHLHLSPPTVSKILKILAEAELVRSQRGAIGGYQLSRPADKITVADVITAMEGEVAMTVCCSKRHCAIDSFCALRQNWRKINDKVQNLLAGLTILDMSRPL